MSEFNFEQLYLMALMNSKKPKYVLNWVYVSRHGPGATKATEICEYFGIDPEGTDFRKAESKEG
ncbi:hypothetical protein OLN43_11020 [Acinetobacter baumannii]|uniref:hypothetical protein n=1 Tax=Acinetobacter baumannii TaxID=470 RepID=UPI0022215E6B|nr:hypothetical protein [Acinetobacter baumannii]MCW1489786.1 hypothetical protein [Acinetobacter baumannii]